MLNILADLLEEKVRDIRAGNSNLTEQQCIDAIDFFNSLRTDKELTRTESANYLHWSLSKFDRAVKAGLLPPGRKVWGGTFVWKQKDLINYVNNYDNKKKN